MREISVREIEKVVESSFTEMAFSYPSDVAKALEDSENNESGGVLKVIEILRDNEQIAKSERIPLCQDTGMAIVFLKIGQDVRFVDGFLNDAINEGVRKAYQGGYLRYSVVSDPLFDRMNTKDNTPAVIHYELVEGDTIEMEMMAKGFGSENVSKVKMLKPSEGVEGVKQFVLDTVIEAGPNGCPPMCVGIGIGSTMDGVALMAKKALFRNVGTYSTEHRYSELEKELLASINETNIGPSGLGGTTTAFSVAIEHAPTHIAGLPVAVNICCHANRKMKVIL